MIIRLRLSFLVYLTALLIALKLAQVIDWPWIWVLAPLWVPVVVVLCIAMVGFLFAATLLARLRKAFGMAPARRAEIVINDDDEPVRPENRPPRRIGNTYDQQ